MCKTARMNISCCWFYCHIVFRLLLLLNVVWEMNAKDSSSGHPLLQFSVSHIVISAIITIIAFLTLTPNVGIKGTVHRKIKTVIIYSA